MAKRRKKTNSKVPAKGRLKDMADQLWSLAIKDDWNHSCAICGSRGILNSHHLIPRRYQATRYELRNGIALCASCHTFDGNPSGCGRPSAHGNSSAFDQWMRERHPDIVEWVGLHNGTKFDGTTNAAYYCSEIRRLKQYVSESDYERIVGVKFSRWLEENE